MLRDPDKLLRRWMGWTSKGLLVCSLFLGSFFAGLEFLGVKFTPPRVARQASSVAQRRPKLLQATRRRADQDADPKRPQAIRTGSWSKRGSCHGALPNRRHHAIRSR